MKKLLAICLAVLLVCTAMPFAFATAADEPTIVVSEAEGKAGDTVVVYVSLKNNPGLVSAKVKVGYDAAALELLEYGAGDLPASAYSWGKLDKNPFVINFCDGIAEADYTEELFATLTFQIKADAAAGAYPLTVEYSCDDDFYNTAWETIYFEEEVGSINVIADEPVPSEKATITLPNIEAAAGDEISVPVLLKNNPGLVSAKVKVGYDASALELTAYEAGEFPASAYSWGKLDKNPFVINFCDGIAEADYAYELLATLTFKVRADAAAGTYALTLEYSCDDDFYNTAWETIYFEGAEGSVVVAGSDPIDPPAGCEHNLVHMDAVEPGCHYEGNIEHWYCTVCEIVWQDAELTQITNHKNVIIPALGGDVVAFEAIEPGCHYDGQIAYWICYECEQVWQDEALTQLTNSKNVILPAIGSENVQHVAAVEPTETENGNIEYWFCPDCEKYWQDEALTQLTNSHNVILPAIGGEVPGCVHEYDAPCDPSCNLCGEMRDVHTEGIIHFDAVEPGCHYVGNIEYWFCAECESFWADEALTQVTNSKSVNLPALGGDVIHFEAIEPGCHYNGRIEYWFCAECEQFWQNEALTQITNSKNVILPATGSENLQHVEAVAPTCQSEGNIEHWFCSDCEQFWQDEALTQLTNSKNVIIGAADHSIVHIDAVEAACHYEGVIEHWYCTECEIVWADEALTQITNHKNVIIPAIGGDVVAFEAIEPACHYNGRIAYWFCPECEQFWQDEALTQLTNSKNVILPAIGSENVQHVEAVAPTCQSEGNIEYWFCSDCEQFWQDEALTQLTNSKNVIIGAADHNTVHMDAVAPGCHYVGNIEYWYCTECEIFWQDEALTQITNSKNVIIPAIGGDVVAFEAIEPSCHYVGQIAYWYCPECEQFWQDEALTQLTNSKNVILPATGSENLQHVEAVDPTCQNLGNIEYWYCPDCEQFWQDEALTQLTNSKNVLIDVIGHNIVHFDAVAPGCHYLGNIEYWFCVDCECYWQNAELTQLTNSHNVILPALGGDVVAYDAVEPGCHYEGNIAYWFCPECEQFWQDEALTQLTNSKNIIVPAVGSENLQHFEAHAPTADQAGYVEHWYCPDCDQVWTNETLTEDSTREDVIIPALGTDEPSEPSEPTDKPEDPTDKPSDKPVDPENPETGDSIVAVVVALLALIASGVATFVLKNKKRA